MYGMACSLKLPIVCSGVDYSVNQTGSVHPHLLILVEYYINSASCALINYTVSRGIIKYRGW